MDLTFAENLTGWEIPEGVACYTGEWCWQPPAADGRIRPDYASVQVMLRKGRNLIEAEVSTTEPNFGWGLTMKVDP